MTGGTCTVGKKQFHFDSCVVAKVQEAAISFSFTHFQTGSRSIFFFFWKAFLAPIQILVKICM